MKKLVKFLRNQKGATAVEYGIMVGLIAAVIITLVIAIGKKTNNAFNAVDSNMTTGGAPFTGS